MKMLKIALIVVCMTLVWCEDCSHHELLSPCECREEKSPNGTIASIYCGGHEHYNIKQIFNRLAIVLHNENKRPHYNTFYFANTAITEFEEHMFHSIVFSVIHIFSGTQLSKIDVRAFGHSTNTIRVFHAFNVTHLENISPKYDIFKALSSLTNIEDITITGSKINVIPNYAFEPHFGVHQNQLRTISIHESASLHSIGDYSFYDVNKLRFLHLYNNIDHISQHAFDFRESSTETLFIGLANNRIHSGSFQNGTLLNAKRPLYIELNANRIDYIEENIFGPFFKLNINNTIDLEFNPLNCTDCRTFWLFKDNHHLKSQIVNGKCWGTEKSLWDSVSQFSHCEH